MRPPEPACFGKLAVVDRHPMGSEADTAQRLLKTVEAALTQLDLDVAVVEGHPNGTIRPPSREGAARGPAEAARSTLELEQTIGEGGMGVVYAASEEALGRTVAVKTLKPDWRKPRGVRKLLQEAWVTGRVEHPNVVPVYRIELDDEGAPMVVLKRIEGDDWASLMHDPRAIAEHYDSTDPLEWNLRVLIAVCNAVRFAHDRGVIHRDIKPENVMIGRYGGSISSTGGLRWRSTTTLQRACLLRQKRRSSRELRATWRPSSSGASRAGSVDARTSTSWALPSTRSSPAKRRIAATRFESW